MTPGGAAVVYDLAPPIQFVALKIKNLSQADKNNLNNFIQNTVNWASNIFDYTDDQNNEHNGCRFWFDDLNFAQTSHQLYAEELVLAVGI